MRRFLLLLALSLGTFALAAPSFLPTEARAQEPKLTRLKVGSSINLHLGGKPREISVENEAIATIEVLEDGQVRLTGVAAGNTTLVGTAADGAELIMPIIVEAK